MPGRWWWCQVALEEDAVRQRVRLLSCDPVTDALETLLQPAEEEGGGLLLGGGRQLTWLHLHHPVFWTKARHHKRR